MSLCSVLSSHSLSSRSLSVMMLWISRILPFLLNLLLFLHGKKNLSSKLLCSSFKILGTNLLPKCDIHNMFWQKSHTAKHIHILTIKWYLNMIVNMIHNMMHKITGSLITCSHFDSISMSPVQLISTYTTSPPLSIPLTLSVLLFWSTAWSRPILITVTPFCLVYPTSPSTN